MRGSVLVGLVVAALVLWNVPRGANSAREPPASGDLQFVPAAGWTQAATGMHPAAPQVPSATAANVPLRDSPGAIPHETLRDLPATGIVVLAAAYVPMHEDEHANFPERALPLNVTDADVRHMWEGQSNRDVPEYVLLERMNGFDLEVRIYFGTQEPESAVLAEAQEELERLVIPLRET